MGCNEPPSGDHRLWSKWSNGCHRYNKALGSIESTVFCPFYTDYAIICPLYIEFAGYLRLLDFRFTLFLFVLHGYHSTSTHKNTFHTSTPSVSDWDPYSTPLVFALSNQKFLGAKELWTSIFPIGEPVAKAFWTLCLRRMVIYFAGLDHFSFFHSVGNVIIPTDYISYCSEG